MVGWLHLRGAARSHSPISGQGTHRSIQDYLEQIQRIISILGTPSSEDQKFITNDGALKYIRSLPKRSKQNWKVLFPSTSSEGLDLLERMLTFNPNKRITAADCLRHPYFEDYDELEESDSCEVLQF